MDVRRQPITWPLSSCHITPGGCKFLGVHQGWCLDSTVAYYPVKHPWNIRASVPALARVTITNVWAEAENKFYAPNIENSLPSLNASKLPNVGHINLIM